MAHLIAANLSNGKTIDQTINSQWIDELEDELDVISIVIGGHDFSRILTSTTTIGEWIAEIEESEEHTLDPAAYFAYASRFFAKDADINQICEGAESKFVTCIREEGADDARAIFAHERAQEYFESLESNLDSDQITFLSNYFNYEGYQHDLFINEFAAVSISSNTHNDVYIFSQK